MIEKLMVFNLIFHHVPGEKNQIVDCFSRLTREIKEAQHYSLCDTVKLSDKAARLKSEGITGFSVVRFLVSRGIEVIVADDGSTDDTRALMGVRRKALRMLLPSGV